MTPEITLITKRGANATLSKRIFLDEAGALKSDSSQCRMAEGPRPEPLPRQPTISPGTLRPVALDRFKAGTLKPGLPSPATVVTKQNLDPNSGAIRN